MRLTVVGSSDAFNSAGRSHSSYLVEGPGVGPVLVDVGGTTLAALRRIGRSPREIEAVALTHLHGDHVGGFAYLAIDAMFNEVRHRALPIVGPALTRERLDQVFRTAYGALADRERPYDTSVDELLPGQSVEVAGVRIEAFAADHMDPPDVPLCLRVSAGGAVIAFSGDTQICDGLFAAAEGADLLVAECTALAPPAGRHCTWQDWRSIFGPGSARPLGARSVLLTHLGRDVRERVADLLVEVSRWEGAPPIAFADDGLVLEVAG